MSKIIVLDDEAFDSLVGTLKQAMDDSKCLNDWLNAKAHAELIESQKDARRSVLEWHPMSEAPSNNAERIFVEYSDGGFGFVFGHPEIIKGDPDYKRWSYLPE